VRTCDYCCSHQQLLHKTQRKWCQCLGEWWQCLWLHFFFSLERRKWSAMCIQQVIISALRFLLSFTISYHDPIIPYFTPYNSNWCLKHSTTVQTHIIFCIIWNLTIHFCYITINTAEKIGDYSVLYSSWTKHSARNLKACNLSTSSRVLVLHSMNIAISLPPICSIFWCEISENVKNKNRKGVFCHNVLFLGEKSPNLWENFGFCFATFALWFW